MNLDCVIYRVNRIFWLFLAVFGCALCVEAAEKIKPVADTEYQQAKSVKFEVNEKIRGAKFTKLAVDYRDSVYVLSDRGVCRDFSGPDFPQPILAKDYTYASLVDLQPLDITTQAETGYLYYLYEDQFLTNAHAGTIYGKFPKGSYDRIQVAADGHVLLTGRSAAALWNGKEKAADLELPDEPILKTGCCGNDFYALSAQTLYRLDDLKFVPIFRGESLNCFAATDEKIYIGTQNGWLAIAAGKDLAGAAVLEPLTDRVPIPAITGVLDVAGRPWFISDNGAFCREPDRYRYFAHRRWLDQNRVIDLAADSEGNLFLLTETGLCEIQFVTMTLAEKAQKIQKDLGQHHIRFGWSAAGNYVDPNDLTTLSLRDSDNDGLWTTFWLGSQAFRYAVTGEEIARRNVWESFEAFERNMSIHTVEGFSGRTFERKGFAGGPEWRDAPESDWVWKGTTSTDEVVGYIFVVDVIDRFVCKTPEEKKRVADYFDALMQHIIRNDYYMVDADGEPTLWAKWNPDYVNSFAKTQFDRKLNSTLITAMLQLAYRLTGREQYRSELARIWKEWGYRDNMMAPMENIKYTEGFCVKPDYEWSLRNYGEDTAKEFRDEGITMGTDWNHSDDEMAFLTYYVLCNTAIDSANLKDYRWIVSDHWQIERPERNALWNVIPYATSGDIDLESTVWWLREFNLDRNNYRMINSYRNDIEVIESDIHKNFREQRTRQLLTQGEMRMMRHNSNGFATDGGGDFGEKLAGDEFLLPYWMCRYYGVIE